MLCSLCMTCEGVSRHHTTPKAKGGKTVEMLCEACHKQIHSLFSNKEIDTLYNSIEKLKQSEKVQKWVKWRQKHPDVVDVKHKMSKERKRFSKYH